MGKNTHNRDGRKDSRHHRERSSSRKNSPHRGSGSASSRHHKSNEKSKKDLQRKAQSRSKVHINTPADVKDRKRSKLDTSEGRKKKGGSDAESRSSSKRNLNVRNIPVTEAKKKNPPREPESESINPDSKTNVGFNFFRVFNRSPGVYQTAVVENPEPASKKKVKEVKPINDSIPSSLESVSTKKGRKIAAALQSKPGKTSGKPVNTPSDDKQKNDKKGPTKLTDDILKTDKDKKKDTSKKDSASKSLPSPTFSEHKNPFKTILKKQIWWMSKPYIRRNKRLSTLLADNKIDIDKIKIDKVDLSLIDIDQLGIENQTIKKSVMWLLK